MERNKAKRSPTGFGRVPTPKAALGCSPGVRAVRGLRAHRGHQTGLMRSGTALQGESTAETSMCKNRGRCHSTRGQCPCRPAQSSAVPHTHTAGSTQLHMAPSQGSVGPGGCERRSCLWAGSYGKGFHREIHRRAFSQRTDTKLWLDFLKRWQQYFKDLFFPYFCTGESLLQLSSDYDLALLKAALCSSNGGTKSESSTEHCSGIP